MPMLACCVALVARALYGVGKFSNGNMPSWTFVGGLIRIFFIKLSGHGLREPRKGNISGK